MTTVKEFFDKDTWTLTYVVFDPGTRDAVVIDPVLDYDPAASKVGETAVTKVMEYLRTHKLKLHYILETHAHADHLSGSQVLKREFPESKIAIGSEIKKVQSVFKDVFALNDFKADGSQFDRLLNDEEVFHAGSISIRTLFTPGHTPACVSYVIGDAVFTGDALFMPDYGTGRCDFPSGSAENLYRSVHDKLYALPESTIVYTGHDYMPGGRPLRFTSTIGEEKTTNIQLKAQTTKEEFVRFRTDRDKTLAAPRLLLPSLHVNIFAGRLPPADTGGKRFLKIPIR